MKSALTVVLLIVLFVAPSRGSDEQTWVTSITTSAQWAVFPCKDYWVTNSCWTDKDYSDAGSLPATVSVGDTVTYVDKDGKQKQFVVRNIGVIEFDKDVDFSYGGKRLTAKKGEMSCNLYDVKDRSATRDTEYPSKIVIKNCRTVAATTTNAQPLGPLISISPQDYLKLPDSAQAIYVAGVIDGVTTTSYGYSLPGGKLYAQCARTMTLGVLARRVADWIRSNPTYAEGTATAVAKTMGAHCAH